MADYLVCAEEHGMLRPCWDRSAAACDVEVIGARVTTGSQPLRFVGPACFFASGNWRIV